MLGGCCGRVLEKPVGFLNESLEQLSSAQEEDVPDYQVELLLEISLLQDEAVEVTRHRVSDRVNEPFKVRHTELHHVSQFGL